MSRQAALGLEVEERCIGDLERWHARRGGRYVVGTDEAGRGPLAGPVTAAAVVLDTSELAWCEGLDDSKRLAAEVRAAWVERIRSSVVQAAVVHVEPQEIDRLNILWASLEGMRRAVEDAVGGAGVEIDEVWVDGNRTIPRLRLPQRALVKGDGRSFAIAAASVLAKEARDAELVALDARWPAYGFARHKGYPTPAHRAALAEHGACPAHRRSFAPVRAALAARE